MEIRAIRYFDYQCSDIGLASVFLLLFCNFFSLLIRVFHICPYCPIAPLTLHSCPHLHVVYVY